MSYAIVDDHKELAAVSRGLLESRGVLEANRALLEAADETLPAHWTDMADVGWFGLNLPEAHGGSGFTHAELAVVLFELGYAAAPGPFLPTVVASSLIAEAGSVDQQAAQLPGFADGSTVAAIGFGPGVRMQDGVASGDAGLVLGAGLANVMALVSGNDVLLVPVSADGVIIEAVDNVDPSRRAARVVLNNVSLGSESIISGGAPDLMRITWLLGSAEAAGTARRCVDMAVEYAKERVQFGRVIGSFQAVKHLCADMFVASEQSIAAVWGAAQADLEADEAEIGAAIAASLALPASVKCAEGCVQVLGGIGFTWEHDAHLFLRRAHATSVLLGGVNAAKERVTELSIRGVRANVGFDIPGDVQALRDEVRDFIASWSTMPEEQRRVALANAGFLMPNWPKPYGREAGPIEQLVIDEEFADHPRPYLGISAWNTLTILQNGTDDQIERWIWPSLHGELDFCQLYSEPEAGSDAAGVKTKAVKVDGGWKVTGQKVWTTGGHTSNRGFATVRTNPDAPKHAGISMMVIDMAAEGVDIRPLRQITGEAHFCEVFLDDVFVPDDDVVGPVDGGWAVARSNLGNERVSIGGRAAGVRPTPQVAELIEKYAPDDVGLAREAGAIIAADVSKDLLNLRRVVRAVEGAEPGPEGAVTKLVQSVANQERARLTMRIVGADGASFVEHYGDPGCFALFVRQNSIAGGTSEIVRNQIGERALGLPREPKPVPPKVQ